MKKNVFFFSMLAVMALSASAVNPIKVDFNNSGRSENESNEPGYTSWKVGKDVHRESKTIDGITFILQSEKLIRGGGNKTIAQSMLGKSRLFADGVNFDQRTAEGTISMIIKGLPVGTHTLKTFHDSWENPANITCYPIHIALNGKEMGIVHRTMRQREAASAAAFTTTITIAQKGDSAVLDFTTTADDEKDDPTKSDYHLSPSINGFVLDGYDADILWALDENAGEDSPTIGYGDGPASFLFATETVKGGQSGKKDLITLKATPSDSALFQPKELNMTVAFNKDEGEGNMTVRLRNGETCLTLGSLSKMAAGKRTELSYALYGYPEIRPSRNAWQVEIQVSSPDTISCYHIGNVQLKGDISNYKGTIYNAVATAFPEGTGSVEPTKIYFVSGQEVNFAAFPAASYIFQHWETDDKEVSYDNPLATTPLVKDTTFRAVFAKANNYLLTVSVAGGKLRVDPKGTSQQGGIRFDEGTSVTLSAFPDSSMYFREWQDEYGTTLSTSNPYTFNIFRDTKVKAVFTDEEVLPLLAFPTAKGYGQYASGGRGGYVVEVTNLSADESVQGSLPWAIRQHSGKPITVVFRVSGTIEGTDRYLSLNRSNVTYAGQTAPGDGICIRNSKVKINGNNVICRNLRFRVGDDLGLSLSAVGIENYKRIIIDHCTISWSTEENVTMYDNDSTTMQYCIISEPLYNSVNYKGARAYGAQWGGEYATYHHNLIAHCASRAPRFNGSSNNDYHGFVDFRNNVVYNCAGSYGGEIRGGGVSCFNQMVNNYYKKGPVSATVFVSPSSPYGEWYIEGNYMEGNSDANANNWKAVGSGKMEETIRAYKPYDDMPILTQTAEEAYEDVMNQVGAIYPKRDAIDERLIREARGLQQPTVVKTYGGAGIIDNPNDVEGWITYVSTEAPVDTDHDGMPDTWETANGLNPQNPEDRNLVTKSGYTCLEVYLNSLCNEKIQLSFPTTLENITAQEPVCYLQRETDVLFITSSDAICKATLVDMGGRAITVEKGSDLREMSLSSCSGGIYLVRLESIDGKIFTQKIIK